MAVPLWRRPSELGRRIAGYAFSWAAGIYGTASAGAVVFGDGETPAQKALDAITVVPDMLGAYRKLRFIAEHKDEVEQAMQYVQQHAPTAEALEQAVERSYSTLQRLNDAVSHFKQAYDQIFTWEQLKPRESLQHLRQGWESLPDLGALRHLASASEQAAELIRYARRIDIDLNPFYTATLNMIDNLSADERWQTIGIGLAALAIPTLIGSYAGTAWARRGIPGFFAKELQNWGARRNPRFYRENAPEILGKQVYEATREHVIDGLKREGKLEKRGDAQ